MNAQVETQTPELDPAAAEAIELARAAAVEVGGLDVGEHTGLYPDGERVVTHTFAATLAGYRGWHWAVTVARAADSAVVTVDEVVLLPGETALRPPAWVPWSERVRPGDLSAGDLLPTAPDDPRLVPSYASDGDEQAFEVATEIGLGRVRVLSLEGRLDAADRWYHGESGPDSPMAKAAPASCGTCGFLVAIGGSLRAAFGVCANEVASTDGRVVSVEYGCGAHSEAVIEAPSLAAPMGVVYDDGELIIDRAAGSDEFPTDEVPTDELPSDHLSGDEGDSDPALATVLADEEQAEESE